MTPDRRLVLELASRRDFVVSTAQCREICGDPSWTERLVKAGSWQRLHRGVLFVHSGPVGWRSRARAALVYAGRDAALSHWSAAFVHGLSSRMPRVIEVSIGEARRVRRTEGVAIHRRRTLPAAGGPLAVVGRADTLLDLLSFPQAPDDAVALICSAVRAGTSPETIAEALARRPQVRRRDLLVELLADVSEGVESPLERRYHRDVERRHRLPRARLQVRQLVGGRWVRADGVYEGLGVRTELDGELAHPGGRTDLDVWRDNAVVIEQRDLTLRYRWRHVSGTPCTTAAQVAAALRSRGWSGSPRPCGPACPVR